MSIKKTAQILLILFSAIVLLHVLALVGLVPMEMLWGGRLESQEQFFVMEGVSVGVNLIAMLFVSLRAGFVGQLQDALFVRVVLWIFCVLFALNTIGNILAYTLFEKAMSLVTLFLAYGFFRLAKGKK